MNGDSEIVPFAAVKQLQSATAMIAKAIKAMDEREGSSVEFHDFLTGLWHQMSDELDKMDDEPADYAEGGDASGGD